MYSCKCKRTFKTVGVMHVHRKRCMQLFFCNECRKSFTTKKLLLAHRELCKFYCKKCSTSFSKKGFFKHNCLCYKCSECMSQFESIPDLNSHVCLNTAKDYKLACIYHSLNTELFNGKLPVVYVTMDNNLVDSAGVTEVVTDNNGDMFIHRILMSPICCYTVDLLKVVLAHEMCHVAAVVLHPTCNARADPHGITFQYYMGLVNMTNQLKNNSILAGPVTVMYNSEGNPWLEYKCACERTCKCYIAKFKEETCPKCSVNYTLSRNLFDQATEQFTL